MRLPHAFIKLPFTFDAGVLAEEIGRLPSSAWMDHPSGMAGNSAAALVSHHGGDNDDFGGPMAATPHLHQSPYHQQVMTSFGEVLSRSRLMKLAGGNEVAAHVDFNYHWYSRLRVHVPVITNPDVIFHCADQQVHMTAGDCWIFDSWRWHKVVNASDEDRVHLVIDLSGSSRFWKMVRETVATNESPVEPTFIGFDPDREVELRLERFNTAPVMAPGELEAITRGIIQDFESCPENPPELVHHYREMLLDFGRDWRELWYLHGQQPDGWPHYRALLQRTQQQLHPDRRALVTASNHVGVNPIIVQRILRPALATELYDDFVTR